MSTSRAAAKITVRGSCGLNWADYVGDMLVDVHVNEGTVQTTTVIGHPIDLESFLGILHLFIDRGLPVIAFEYRQADSDVSSPGSAAWMTEVAP